jgi:hypothetical protein
MSRSSEACSCRERPARTGRHVACRMHAVKQTGIHCFVGVSNFESGKSDDLPQVVGGNADCESTCAILLHGCSQLSYAVVYPRKSAVVMRVSAICCEV